MAELLTVLAANAPSAVAKNDLTRALWPDTFVEDGALARLIADLRAALGDTRAAPKFVRTVPCFGYALDIAPRIRKADRPFASFRERGSVLLLRTADMPDTHAGTTSSVRLGPYRLETDTRRLYCYATEVRLSPKEFELLKTLVEHAPDPTPEDTLIRAIWADSYGHEGRLMRLIADLRRAIGDRNHEIVRTVRNRGYVFVAPVHGHPRMQTNT